MQIIFYLNLNSYIFILFCIPFLFDRANSQEDDTKITRRVHKHEISQAYRELAELRNENRYLDAEKYEKYIDRLVAKYKEQDREKKRFFAVIVQTRRNKLETILKELLENYDLEKAELAIKEALKKQENKNHK